MKYFLLSIFFTLSVVFIGCGGNSQPSKNPNGQISNSKSVENANSNTQLRKPSANEIPAGKPLEGGTPEKFKDVSFIVPKDWKKGTVTDPNFAVKYVSTDINSSVSFTVAVSESIAEQKGKIPAANIEDYIKEVNPAQKARLLEINGTKGILMSFGEQTNWLTFPPRDKNGKTVITDISIYCPIEQFEQNQQLIADIIYSVKINK